MAKNAALGKAKEAKQDEFYTQLSDIEAELRHYRDFFRGKVVFCNCDDPYESNFFKYFAMSFNALGLKKLIATCYATSPVVGQELPYYETTRGQLSFFLTADTKPVTPGARRAYKVVITEVTDENGDGAVDLADVETLLKNRHNVMTLLDGDGDFRSPECIELLKQADVIVTNPPFSLFREYVAQLIEYGKYFLIIGSKNAITYREIFPLFRDNKMWFGYGFTRGDAYFSIPKENARDFAQGVYNKETGLVHFRNCTWFTNIDIEKRHEKIVLWKCYTPEAYPKYANYDAIEVSKTSDIPCDYDGEMGVPITFLDKYNPEQFEIIGSSRWLGRPMSEIAEKGTYVAGGIRFYLPIDKSDDDSIIARTDRRYKYKCLYDRIVIKIRQTVGYVRLYDRIVIRRKQVTPDED